MVRLISICLLQTLPNKCLGWSMCPLNIIHKILVCNRCTLAMLDILCVVAAGITHFYIWAKKAFVRYHIHECIFKSGFLFFSITMHLGAYIWYLYRNSTWWVFAEGVFGICVFACELVELDIWIVQWCIVEHFEFIICSAHLELVYTKSVVSIDL